MSRRHPARVLATAALLVTLGARPTAAGSDSTTVRAQSPGGGRGWLEATHITPPPQPPLTILGAAGVEPVRAAFRAGDGTPRIVLLMSPSCPYCRRGLERVGKVIEQYPDSRLRALLIWEHATAHDRQVPDTEVLALMPDPRVIQFWDPDRLVSTTMMRELPPAVAWSLADTTGGAPPLIWDAALVYGPRARWNERVPAPGYSATPVADSLDALRAALARALLGRE